MSVNERNNQIYLKNNYSLETYSSSNLILKGILRGKYGCYKIKN